MAIVAGGIASGSPKATGVLVLRLNKHSIQSHEDHALGSDSKVIKTVDRLPSHCGPPSAKKLERGLPPSPCIVTHLAEDSFLHSTPLLPTTLPMTSSLLWYALGYKK